MSQIDLENQNVRAFEFKRGEDFQCTGLIIDNEFRMIISHKIPENSTSEVQLAFFKEAENAFEKRLLREAKKNAVP